MDPDRSLFEAARGGYEPSERDRKRVLGSVLLRAGIGWDHELEQPGRGGERCRWGTTHERCDVVTAGRPGFQGLALDGSCRLGRAGRLGDFPRALERRKRGAAELGRAKP